MRNDDRDIFWRIPDVYEDGVIIVIFHKDVLRKEAEDFLRINGFEPRHYSFIKIFPQIFARILVPAGKELEWAAKLDAAILVEMATLAAKP